MKNLRLFKDTERSVMIDCNEIIATYFSGDFNSFRIRTSVDLYEFSLALCVDDGNSRDKFLLNFIEEIQFLKVADLVIDFSDDELIKRWIK